MRLIVKNTPRLSHRTLLLDCITGSDFHSVYKSPLKWLKDHRFVPQIRYNEHGYVGDILCWFPYAVSVGRKEASRFVAGDADAVVLVADLFLRTL
jgi:hypothetical protein